MPLTVHHLRLGSGLVSYISLHLFNHMLGIVSLPLAETGLRWSIRLWQSAPGTAALYGTLALHLRLRCARSTCAATGICRPLSGCVCGRA
jgi:adenylate cyclase